MVIFSLTSLTLFIPVCVSLAVMSPCVSTKIYTIESEELFSSSEETSKKSKEDPSPFYPRSKRLSAVQRACLSVYCSNGMTSFFHRCIVERRAQTTTKLLTRLTGIGRLLV